MAAKDDPRFKHVTKMIASQLSTSELTVTPAQVDKGSNATWVGEFLAAGVDGLEPRMALLFYLQPKDGGGAPTVFMATPDTDLLTGKCAYVVRISDPTKPLPEKDPEDNLNFGTLASGQTMHTLMRLVADLYSPLVSTNTFAFKKKMNGEQLESLKTATSSFCSVLEKVHAKNTAAGVATRARHSTLASHCLCCSFRRRELHCTSPSSSIDSPPSNPCCSPHPLLLSPLTHHSLTPSLLRSAGHRVARAHSLPPQARRHQD